MEVKRKPFQGVWNIIRFNWHFYFIAGLIVISFSMFNHLLPQHIRLYAFLLALLATFAGGISLLVSYYIYDHSDLYKLKWIPDSDHKRILSVNAGFDETSEIIKNRFPNSDLVICDFFSPSQYNEVSIKRARKAYPPGKNTIKVSVDQLPFLNETFDCVLAILSAHEIRNESERIHFFRELNRVTKNTGNIVVTEHLRDFKNFMAYTIGFLHFHSKTVWLSTFLQANLKVKQEVKITPFITTFTLEKYGNSL